MAAFVCKVGRKNKVPGGSWQTGPGAGHRERRDERKEVMENKRHRKRSRAAGRRQRSRCDRAEGSHTEHSLNWPAHSHCMSSESQS